MAKKSTKQQKRPKRNREPVSSKYDQNTGGQKRTIPLILALADKILTTIGFVDFINDVVEWDAVHLEIQSGTRIIVFSYNPFSD